MDAVPAGRSGASDSDNRDIAARAGTAGAPIVTFYRLFPHGRLPQRADRSAGGTIPTRAYRYCEAIAAASSYGWYLFPPINFSLVWDGSGVLWTYEGVDEWYPLRSAQLPGFSDYFDANAPDDIKSYAPPFLSVFVEPGIVQIWPGIVARTAPEWSLLVRPVANLPRGAGYEPYEGIVESDRWFGPLFTNIRLTRTDVPIEFRIDIPLVQLQPVPRYVYADSTLDSCETVSDIAELSREDWDRYRETVVKPSVAPVLRPGRYAVASRKRPACPYAHASSKLQEV